jgi:uncharacterized membrane protein
MFASPYVEMAFRVCVFAFWSSFWPRSAVKGRLEPLLGYRTYRMIYNVGTMGLLAWAYAFLVYKSPDTIQLWDLRGHVWFKPLVYGIEALGIFFLTSLVQFGLPFWGLKEAPACTGLHTSGFYKITRHPLYWSVFCLFFGHTLVMGTGLALLFFVLIELYNVVGVIALENRALARRFGGEFEAFQARTSTVPFLSLLDGRARLSAGELPLRWIAGAVGFTLAIALLHDPLILGTISFVRPLMMLGSSG